MVRREPKEFSISITPKSNINLSYLILLYNILFDVVRNNS